MAFLDKRAAWLAYAEQAEKRAARDDERVRELSRGLDPEDPWDDIILSSGSIDAARQSRDWHREDARDARRKAARYKK